MKEIIYEKTSVLYAEYRGQGIGSKLLNLATDHALNLSGIEKIELDVYKSNKGAIALYEKNGFVKEGEKLNHRKLDGIYDNLIIMGKIL